MLHVLQSLRTGATELADVPLPRASGNTLVVETRASVISPGTERMIVDFARAGWIDKARSQPEKVRQVLDKVVTDGLGPTLESVRAKLDAPVPLGYCQAGLVREVGSRVTAFTPGDRVVTNGPHAEYVRVPYTLAARIPESVSFEAAAFAPLAAIALQGLRLANPTLGESVIVFGLGPIGLLAVQLARAAGCRAIGIDRAADRCALAERFGATTIRAEAGVDLSRTVTDITNGVGADIVLLTLASDSDEPIHQAAEMSRKRGRIVLTGVTGLELRRDDFYRKELSFQVSCSYGPGRYDPEHEEGGVDYPLPYVRWTEARNFEAVLGLMADGRLDPLPLVSHRFRIAEAPAAYDLISNGAQSLGVVLTYDAKEERDRDAARTVVVGAKATKPGSARVGFIGSGNFASRVLIPAFDAAGATLDVLASSGGVSASIIGKQKGFHRVTTDAASVIADPEVDMVVIATRHDSHADWTARALDANKHVFVEKPLALARNELERVAASVSRSTGTLCVGFNRRFARDVRAVEKPLGSRMGPVVLSVTVNAGLIPRDHWTQDPEVGGGRIIGEACHFIDLCRHLARSPIKMLQVVTARGASGSVADDIALMQLSFEDGSAASIQYVSNGDKGFPKERVEMFFDGKVIRLDNFRKIFAWGITGLDSRLPRSQDKGHAALVAAFLKSVQNGDAPPISANELLEVALVSIEAGRLAREGGGSIDIAELLSAIGGA
jgi:predicted dehydrogenase/threonine dehydrogenase-like Zn-dependent dehydrogenase